MYIYPSSPESASFLQSEESAAIKIQAEFRGYRVRKQYHRQNTEHKSYGTNRLTSRFSQTRRQHQHRPESADANMATQHKQNKGTNYDVPIAIGNKHTASIVDCLAMTSVEDRCATKIQAGVRGFLVRKKHKIANDAAVKIQAGFRGFKARKEAQKLKQQ